MKFNEENIWGILLKVVHPAFANYWILKMKFALRELSACQSTKVEKSKVQKRNGEKSKSQNAEKSKRRKIKTPGKTKRR